MNNIELELEQTIKELHEIKKELKSLPPGRLVRKGMFYYHHIDEKEKGITNDHELLRRLCRKKYLTVRQKYLNADATTMRHFIKKYYGTTPEEIIGELPSTYKSLPNIYFFRQQEYGWASQPFEKNAAHPEALTYTSNGGIAVRSKSEALIANQLEFYNIPYRYEAAFTFCAKKKYPDFTIKQPSTGEILLWEHFGALHQPGYVEKMTEKLGLYAEHGFIPFKNFVCTFEFDIQNIERVRNYIERIILA